MTEKVIYMTNQTPSTRLSLLGNPNVKVPKQALKKAYNDKRNDFYSLISNFPKPTSMFNATLLRKYSVRLYICTNSPLIYSAPRRLSPEMLKQVQTEFNSMLQVRIISRTYSKWASSLHVVEKLDQSYRPCGDYPILSNITTRAAFSISHLFNFVNNLKGYKIFSKIGLYQTYHRIPVTATGRDKMAITTSFGNYCFNIIPFGVCGAPSTL